MYRRKSRVLYELPFLAFDWFQILMYDRLLILTYALNHITYTIA